VHGAVVMPRGEQPGEQPVKRPLGDALVVCAAAVSVSGLPVAHLRTTAKDTCGDPSLLP
jgi:hypothetical protein